MCFFTVNKEGDIWTAQEILSFSLDGMADEKFMVCEHLMKFQVLAVDSISFSEN